MWEAFQALDRDRPTGFGVGAIPFGSIDTFAKRYGVDDVDHFDNLRRLVQKMDVAFIEHFEKIREAKEKQGKNGHNR